MKHCITLDPCSLAPIEIHKIKGVDVKVSFSPYDVPERVCIDEDEQRGLVEFEYPGEEALVRKDINKYAVLWVGKNSERIYRIEIDLGRVRNETSGLSMTFFSAARAAIEAAKNAKQSLAGRYALNQQGLDKAANSISLGIDRGFQPVLPDPDI